MPDEASGQRAFAVLIDGDNIRDISAGFVEQMLDEVRREGKPIIRRVYGDWTNNELRVWKELLHRFAFTPMQQFRYVNQGNSTDCAMIIDAMDVLHEREVDGFCIVSSDSDFTRLATRMQEAGKYVLGIGRADAPEALKRACNRYVEVETLARAEPAPEPQKHGSAIAKKLAKVEPSPPAAAPTVLPHSEALGILLRALDLAATADGVAHIGNFGAKIYSIEPTFDSRKYGTRNLRGLLEKFPAHFVLETDSTKGGAHIYVRRKS